MFEGGCSGRGWQSKMLKRVLKGVNFAWVFECGDHFCMGRGKGRTFGWQQSWLVGDLAGDTAKKRVYSLEEVLARASPTKIHANFLRAVEREEELYASYLHIFHGCK